MKKKWSPSKSEHFEISVQKPPMGERVKAHIVFVQVYYPVQYNWVEKLTYIGREMLGIEYINRYHMSIRS